MPRDDKHYVNVRKKFKEKAPSVIEKMKMEKAEAEEKQKALMEERRSKGRNKGDLTKKDLLEGNIPPEVILEIARPDKQFERKRFTKDYMLDFFKRNLTRKTQEKELPPYLKPY